jgi:transposase-like protein
MTTRERHWRELIKEYEEGAVTIREFCATHEVSPASFYQWRRRLRESAGVMKFALIEPVAEKSGGAIELRLGTGEALVIPTGADPATLHMVLNVIREQTP